MALFPCKVCSAKDAEINRLTALLQASIDRAERQAGELLNMARETAGLRATIPAGPQPLPAEMLAPEIELFLDARFVHGTPLWRQQRREAEKLAAELDGSEDAAARIVEILAKGQRVEF